MTEYAPYGQIGVLTPQANSTVEPEFWAMAPPGLNLICARLTSVSPTLNARLVDYLEGCPTAVEQFGGAALSAVAFACTGSSYLAAPGREAAVAAAVEARFGAPVVTAAGAVLHALRTLRARRIALVSPYPDDLTAASAAFWAAQGLEVCAVARPAPPPADGGHPIYALQASAVRAALDEVREGADAVVLLGTGAPTLGVILDAAGAGAPPVVSSMLCLGWLAIARATRTPADLGSLTRWTSGAPWRAGLQARRAPCAHAR